MTKLRRLLALHKDNKHVTAEVVQPTKKEKDRCHWCWKVQPCRTREGYGKEFNTGTDLRLDQFFVGSVVERKNDTLTNQILNSKNCDSRSTFKLEAFKLYNYFLNGSNGWFWHNYTQPHLAIGHTNIKTWQNSTSSHLYISGQIQLETLQCWQIMWKFCLQDWNGVDLC